MGYFPREASTKMIEEATKKQDAHRGEKLNVSAREMYRSKSGTRENRIKHYSTSASWKK